MTQQPGSQEGPPHAGTFDSSNYNPFLPEHLADPYPWWDTLTQTTPVCFIPMLNMWAVIGYDCVAEVIKDTVTFSSAKANYPGEVPAELSHRLPSGYPHSVPTLVNNDPPHHTRIRKHIAKLFTPTAIAKYEPLIRATANSLVDGFINHSQVDLLESFAVPLPILVISHILGVTDLDIATIKRRTDAGFELTNPILTHNQRVTLATQVADSTDFAISRLRERRAHPQNDLLTALIQLREGDEPAFSEPELLSIFPQLLGAGNETVTHLIANMIFLLLQDKNLWAEVRTNSDKVSQAVEETLRLKSSLRGLFRTTTRDVELAGVRIPKDAMLWVVFASAGYDHTRFLDPTRFDLDRSNAHEHLAFGKWTHFCLGAPLARLEARIALNVLTERLPDLELAQGWEPEYLASIVSQGLRILPVQWKTIGILNV